MNNSSNTRSNASADNRLHAQTINCRKKLQKNNFKILHLSSLLAMCRSNNPANIYFPRPLVLITPCINLFIVIWFAMCLLLPALSGTFVCIQIFELARKMAGNFS